MAYKSIFELAVTVTQAGKNVLKNISGQTKRAASDTAQATGLMQSAWAKTALALGSVAVAAAAAKRALDFAIEGEKAANIATAFEGMVERSGAALNDLDKAFRGTLDETSLQRFGLQLQDLGVSTQDFGKLASVGFVAAAKSGRDVAGVMQAIAVASATGRTATLAQYGIVIDANEAYKAYADKLGVAVGELDKAAKNQAVLNAVMAQGSDLVSKVPLEKLSTDMQRVSTAIENLKSDLSILAAEAGGGLLTWVDAASDGLADLALILSGESARGYKEAKDAANEYNEVAELSIWRQKMLDEATQTLASSHDDASEALRVRAAALEKYRSVLDGLAAPEDNRSDQLEKLVKTLEKAAIGEGDSVDALQQRLAKLQEMKPVVSDAIVALGFEDTAVQSLIAKYKGLVTSLQETIDKKKAAAAAARNLALLNGLLAETDHTLLEGQAKLTAVRQKYIDSGKGLDDIRESYIALALAAGSSRHVAIMQADQMVAGLEKQRVAFKRSHTSMAKASKEKAATVSLEEERIRRILASGASEEEAIVKRSELALLGIENELKAGRIDAKLAALRAFEQIAMQEGALQKIALDREKEILRQKQAATQEYNNWLQREVQRSIQIDADKARAQQEAYQANVQGIRDMASGIQSAISDTQLTFNTWQDHMQVATKGAAGAIENVYTAFTEGSKSYGKAIPGAIAASGQFASAFIADEKARAVIRGLFESAASVAAFASGNVKGGLMHALSASMFFIAAGKTGKKPAVSSGTTSAAAPTQLSQAAPSSAPANVTINLRGFAIGSTADMGKHVAAGLNAAAGHVKLDKRLQGDGVMGF